MSRAHEPRLLRPIVVYGLGSVLIVANAWFGTYAYVVVQAILWTQIALLRGPLVFLAALALANALLLGLGARRGMLSRQELIVLYAMLCLAACAGGYGGVQLLVGQLVAPVYFAGDANAWAQKLWPHIPLWLAPRDPGVVDAFFRGNATLYDGRVLAAWAVPALAWGAFLLTVFWVLLCLASLVRHQWVEEERLTFPLVLLPLEMASGAGRPDGAEPRAAFWRSRAMWLGFLVAGALESVNALAFLYPNLPSLPLKATGLNRLDYLLASPPWDRAGMVGLSFYPFLIGIAYLLPLDVSFSAWFFYLLLKGGNVACAAWGLSDGGGGAAGRAPFVREQGVGAFIALALLSLWRARPTLLSAWRAATDPPRAPTGGTAEADTGLMPPRLMVLGGGAGVLILIGFLIAAGLPPVAAGLYVVVYLCFALALARIVAEAGAGWIWLSYWTPTAFTADLLGASSLGPRGLTVLHGLTPWLSDMRDCPLPQQLQALRLARDGGIGLRALLGPLVWASGLGILAALWAHLDLFYAFGAASAKVRPALASTMAQPARQVQALLAAPTWPDGTGLAAAGAAALLTGVLTLARQRLPWCPLHPVGYAMATMNSMDFLWCPFLVAWALKALTLRYGGIRAYRAALPFFLGLILGDYVVPTLWAVIGMLTGQQQYMTFPV